MKKNSILLIAINMLTIQMICRGQEVHPKINLFTKEQMKENWAKFSSDEGFSILQRDVMTKGYEKIEGENNSWGFQGILKDANGKDQKVTFCAYDFYNPKSSQYGSRCDF